MFSCRIKSTVDGSVRKAAEVLEVETDSVSSYLSSWKFKGMAGGTAKSQHSLVPQNETVKPAPSPANQDTNYTAAESQLTQWRQKISGSIGNQNTGTTHVCAFG